MAGRRGPAAASQGRLLGHRSAEHGGRAVRDKNPQEPFAPRGSALKGQSSERASVPALPLPGSGTCHRPQSPREAQFIRLWNGSVTGCSLSDS